MSSRPQDYQSFTIESLCAPTIRRVNPENECRGRPLRGDDQLEAITITELASDVRAHAPRRPRPVAAGRCRFHLLTNVSTVKWHVGGACVLRRSAATDTDGSPATPFFGQTAARTCGGAESSYRRRSFVRSSTQPVGADGATAGPRGHTHTVYHMDRPRRGGGRRGAN